MGLYFDGALQALTLANPFVLCTRFSDGLAHCVEASLGASAALRRFRGIHAKPLLCGVVGRMPRGDEDLGVSIGLTMREIYDAQTEEGRTTFDEWLVEHGTTLANIPTDPIHVIVEARMGSSRALVDLTLGQLARLGMPVGLQYIHHGSGWPSLYYETGAELHYRDARTEAALPPVGKHQGIADDYYDLMTMAQNCDLDEDRFFEAVRAHDFDAYQTTMRRMQQFMAHVP